MRGNSAFTIFQQGAERERASGHRRLAGGWD
jgi:hypothetical protein